MTGLLAAVLAVLSGCAFLQRESRSAIELNLTADALAADIGRRDLPRNLVFLGIRGGDGEQTPETKVVDRLLIETLGDAGFLLGVDERAAKESWTARGVLPLFDDAVRPESSHLLGGRLHTDERWSYLQLAFLDRRTGAMQLADLQRVSTKSLQRSARASFKWEPQGTPPAIELHILGLRRDLGFAEQVQVEDGAVLEKGDELQIRFRPDVECDVFAFLLSASGDTWPMFKRTVFGGRSRYRPYESIWLRLDNATFNAARWRYGGADIFGTRGKGDFTLYFAAAARLEDGEEMFLAIEELFNGRSGEIRDWSPVDKSVERHLFSEDDGAVTMMQGGQPSGETVRFLLDDGTVLENRSEKLRGTPVVFRVLRFSVQ